jgi:hypothetical protein
MSFDNYENIYNFLSSKGDVDINPLKKEFYADEFFSPDNYIFDPRTLKLETLKERYEKEFYTLEQNVKFYNFILEKLHDKDTYSKILKNLPEGKENILSEQKKVLKDLIEKNERTEEDLATLLKSFQKIIKKYKITILS